MSIPAPGNLKQATGPIKTAGLTRYDATCRGQGAVVKEGPRP
jgi:hypothetical protein